MTDAETDARSDAADAAPDVQRPPLGVDGGVVDGGPPVGGGDPDGGSDNPNHGGQDSGAGGSDASTATCNNYSDNQTGVEGSCTVSQSYSCDDGNTYAIDCACPAAACVCRKNGQEVGPTLVFDTCPVCTTPPFGDLADLCGFPY